MENKAYRNKEFYEHMKKAVKASLDYLNEVAKKPINPLLFEVLDLDLDPRDRVTNKFVKYGFGEILKLREVVTCIDFMVKSNFHKMLEIDNDNYEKQLADKIIKQFLRKYTDKRFF